MGQRQHHRTAGLGSIQRRCEGKTPYYVFAPQTKGTPKRTIGSYDTRWRAERALSAWYVVEAMVMLAALGGTCVARSA